MKYSLPHSIKDSIDENNPLQDNFLYVPLQDEVVYTDLTFELNQARRHTTDELDFAKLGFYPKEL